MGSGDVGVNVVVVVGVGEFIGLTMPTAESDSSLCSLVRSSCRAVIDSAQLVVIDADRLAAYAEELAASNFNPPDAQQPGLARDHGPLPSPGGPDLDRVAEEAARRIVTLNAVNFGSGWHDVVDKEPGMSGARTMAYRLGRAIGSAPDDDFCDWLVSTSNQGWAEIFGQSVEHRDQAELVAHFAAALRALGRFVSDDHGGSFAALVSSAGGSAERLATELLAMRAYRDHVTLDGLDVYFYKRAQITPADLGRELAWWGPAQFDDLDRLTAFADNLVPHVLRIDGVIGVDDAVVATIERGQRLQFGERAEVELRAAAVEATERLTKLLDHPDHRVRAMDVDLALWERGGQPRYKAVPRHRTRCTFY